MKLKLW